MSTQPPPAKRRRIDFFEEFKIVLGTDSKQKTITVAKSYLVNSSDYLKKACSKDWEEGQTKTVRLPDVDPDIFAIYLQWLQTRDLVLTDEEMPSIDADKSVRVTYHQQIGAQIIDLFILADYLANTTMRNLVIDEWLERTHALGLGPSHEQIKRAYDETPQKSMLRRLYVDWSVASLKEQWIIERGMDYPKEFLVDMIAEWSRLRDAKEEPETPRLREKCTYHEHDEAHPKCA